jgi:hypothetical protein
MIESKYSSVGFWSYLIVEIAMCVVLSVGFTILVTLKLAEGDFLDYVLNNPIVMFAIVAVVILFTIGLLMYFRNFPLIVGAEINNQSDQVKFLVRRIPKSSLTEIIVSKSSLKLREGGTPGFFLVNEYKGLIITSNRKKVGYLLFDHFVWEEQIQDYRAIRDQLGG